MCLPSPLGVFGLSLSVCVVYQCYAFQLFLVDLGGTEPCIEYLLGHGLGGEAEAKA